MALTRPVPTFGPGAGQTTLHLKISLHLLQVILAMPRHQQEELTSTVMEAFKRDFSGEWIGGSHPSKPPTFCRPGCPHPDGDGRQRHPGGAAHLRRHLSQVAFEIRLSSTISFILFRGQGLQVKGA